MLFLSVKPAKVPYWVIRRGGAMGGDLNVESTKNEQKSLSTTNPIILQSTTDFSEILQHSIHYIILLYFHESILLISQKYRYFILKYYLLVQILKLDIQNK